MSEQTEREQQELLPCPHCGGNAGVRRLGDQGKYDFVMCDDCGAHCSNVDTLPQADCVAAWNRRAPNAERIAALARDLDAALAMSRTLEAQRDAAVAEPARLRERLDRVFDRFAEKHPEWKAIIDAARKDEA